MLTYKLHCARDLLEKLRNDLKLLQEQVTSYRFFNFVITGYHIIDWIKNDEAIHGNIRGAVKDMYGNEYISVCRDIANASKHYKLKNYSNRKTKSAKSVQGPYGTGRYGKGVFGIGEEQITIECSDDREYDALEFARAILKTWEDFFKKHKLTRT